MATHTTKHARKHPPLGPDRLHETSDLQNRRTDVPPADAPGAPASAPIDAPLQPIPAILPTATVELSLFAPTIDSAAIAGDFTRWQDLPMTKDNAGNWRIAIELPDGDYEYRFKLPTKSWFYEPGKIVTITDPKATRVDPDTGNGVLRIRQGKIVVDEYHWQHDDHPLPANNELVIYELHVADFSGGEADIYQRGQFKHVTEKLDYLADLGINCLELLPIKEYPGEYAWGYTPQYFFAPESAYGKPEDLKHLIDEAHARGMRVIFDGVYNHGHTDTPLAQIDHDYWFHHDPKDKNLAWGPQYNYEFTDPNTGIMPARKFINENIEFWVGQYHIDGIRFDAAKQIENFDALRMMKETGHRVAGNKPFIAIAEYLPESPDIAGPLDSGKPMDAVWQDSFYWTIGDQAIAHGHPDLERIKDVLHPMRRGFSDCTQIVNYCSNHDHLRLMPHMAKSLVFDEPAFARAKLAATLVFTAVGIPMIWMGEEFADYHGKAMDPQKIDWTLLANDHNKELREHYKKMIHLRRENTALHRNDLAFFYEHAADGILAFARWDDTGKQVVVIANFKDQPHDPHEVTNFPDGDTWTDYLTGEKVEIKNHQWTGPLAPWEAKVFIRG
ncbi:MAG TPA: alpha-amylase family glycosyl hydrolase [Phycisphaerae bacterium]|nr:alpha-amylase family glycosyl hydrolase [Phycisphaerae bacterium]